ncbi:hypothetical protein DOY81_008294, partial [Sarcophaga bullata]
MTTNAAKYFRIGSNCIQVQSSRQMDSNKFYCRKTTPVTLSSALSATDQNGACGVSSSQEYSGCEPTNSTTAFNCTEPISRNSNSTGKSSHNLRLSNCSVAYGNVVSNNSIMSVSTAASIAAPLNNSSSHCSNNVNSSNGTGTYINVMTVPIGTLQYHRRKLTPQEYQSRVYHNTADYRCRDDFYSGSNGANNGIGSSNSVTGRINSASPLPVQLQGQGSHHHQQHNHQIQHQTHYHHHHQVNQQTSQEHYHHYNQQQQASSSANIQQLHQQQQQQQHTCSPTSINDPNENTLNCSLTSSTGRMVAATQTHQTSGDCDQMATPTSIAMSSLHSQVPPIMYTVHRVVTTAQIQTSGGNTFTSSSSVSSVMSAVRNENDNLGNVITPVSTPSNAGCFISGDISGCTSNISADGNINHNIGVGQTHLHNSPAISTNANNYMTNQIKGNSSTEMPRISNVTIGNAPSTSNGSYTTGAKNNTSISRPLQNVIPTCVYLMSRVAVHMEIEGTAQCPSQVMLAAALGCEELGIANKLLAQSIFGLWMTSALLEIQLKSHQRPYVVRVAWPNLLEKFSHGNPIEKKFDEPMVIDHRILELLYEEAKHNVLSGRYIMESVHSLMLGGIQARIELGPFNSHTHTISFFRENQSRFLPQHVAKNSNWSWLPVSRKNSAEVRLLEQFKRVPQTATTRKLMRKYLEFCWALPFYGAAFFHGQVEQPIRGLMSLVNHKDVEVLIAVNERGVFIIDPMECTLLLGLRYEELSWDFAKPSASDNPECQT